jgi:very-short-patch-repair endonuclease
MQSVLRAQWNWPRIIHAMSVVREADGRSESALESYIRGRCIRLRLPRPQLQHWLGDEHAPIARVDFWWDEFRLVGEADGRLKYDPDQDPDDNALRREKDREEKLRDRGVEVIRWSWLQAHAPDVEFTARLEAAMRRGLASRIARQLAAELLPENTHVIDLRRFSLRGLT